MDTNQFSRWFYSVTPYINAHRGKVFVLAVHGDTLLDDAFQSLAQDINLLLSLGIRVVLVYGAKPQIEAALQVAGISSQFHQGMRITTAAAMSYCKRVVGELRIEIEAYLSMALANSSMANADIRVTSGNYITARPMGVIDGIDLQHTGTVRKVDHDAIQVALLRGELVLIPCLGYSPTGEVFNIAYDDVAVATAAAVRADKLVFMTRAFGLLDDQGEMIHEVTIAEARALLKVGGQQVDAELGYLVESAVTALYHGVARTHLVSHVESGALLRELFTHGGGGTMITRDVVEILRRASIDDVGGILQLIEPLEEAGLLVRRGRERLEIEIDRFLVVEHDGLILGCVGLYPFDDTQDAEAACLAVRQEYRRLGYGDRLLRGAIDHAKYMGLQRLWVLTTQTGHWFIERGFSEVAVDRLPAEKQAMYNWQRCSKVLMRAL